MTHFSTIVTFNFCHIGLALSLTILFRVLCLLFVRFVLRVLFSLAFLVRTISCFVSNLSTVATSSFELFFLPFLFGRASKQCIVIFFFLLALDILHGQIFIFQELLNFSQSPGSTSQSLLDHKDGSLVLCLWE